MRFLDGSLKCWGDGTFGKLGQGNGNTLGKFPADMGDNLPTVDLGAGLKVVATQAGGQVSCALLEAGQVKCWGFGSLGQLAQGDSAHHGDNPGEMGDNLPPVDLGSSPL